MRHIIIVLFLLPIVAFGQYPINVRNIQTGYQTSGEGLFFRGNGYPNYTPTDSLRRHGTFMHIDTVNVRIWTYMQDTTNADSGWVKIFPIDVPPAILNGEVVGPIANNKLGVVNRIKFNTTYTPIVDTLGTMWFDTNSETINAIINGGTRYQLGEELFYPIIINKSGSAILKGQLVMVDTVTPISGDHIRVVPAVNNGTYSSTTIMGVAASQIENDATGLITWFGYVSELKQSEIAQTGITLDIGDILYPSTTQAGRYTDIAPSSPSHKSSIALVVRKPSDNNITILVRPWLAPKLDDLSNVDVTGRIINSGLLWNGANWKATTNQIPTIATGNEDYLVKFKGTDLNTGEITIGNSVVKESTDSIGIDITPTEKLDVGGTLRVRNTNKPVTTTKLLGVNDNGVVQEVSVPTGLSGNSLVITGSTDLSTQQSSANVLLNSSTGTDVTLIPGGGTTLTSGSGGTNVTISSSNVYNANGSIPANTSREVTMPSTSKIQLKETAIKYTDNKGGASVFTNGANNLEINSVGLLGTGTQVNLQGGVIDMYGQSTLILGTPVPGLSVNANNKVVVTESSNGVTDSIMAKTASNELKALTPLNTRAFILPTQNGNNGKYLRTNGSDVTWESVTGNTDLSFAGTTSPVTLNSSTGTDVTITAGSNVTLSQTGNNLTISSTNSGGTVTGTGDVNKIPKWTTTTALGNSVIEESAAGNIGIGKTPSFKLDVAGDALINDVRVGLGNGGLGTNLAFGKNSLNSVTTGGSNVGIGTDALKSVTVGNSNLAVGTSALASNTNGAGQLAIGPSALFSFNITDASAGGSGNNTAVGNSALYSLVKDVPVDVASNTAIGATAMFRTKNSDGNTAVGVNAMRNAEGLYNVAVGFASLFGTQGTSPLYRKGVNYNVSIGTGSLQNFGLASEQTTSITNNVAIGYQAANNVGTTVNRTLTNSIYIGSGATVSSGTNNVTNEIAIGQGAVGNGSNTTTIGNSSTTTTIIPSGKLGVGTTSPDSTLTVNGGFRTVNDANINGIRVGRGGGNFNTSVAIGLNALNSTNTFGFNVAIGNEALRDQTSGYYNIAIGPQALKLNTYRTNLIAIGYRALELNSTGTFNVAVGSRVLANNTSGINNTGFGHEALLSNITGSYNLALGALTLNTNADGEYNIALGTQALYLNQSGDYNAAIGRSALYNNTASENFALGAFAMEYITTGERNIAIGNSAGRFINSGSNNQTSSNSIYIGYDARPSANGNQNETVIGYQGRGNGSNTTTIGNSSTTKTVLPAGTLTLSASPPAIASNSNQVLLRNTSTGEVSSLVGTVNDQVLKWDNTSSRWYAGTDDGGGGSTGLTSLNGLSASSQTFAVGASPGISISSAASSHTFTLANQALAFHNLATNGIVARTGAGTVAARTITGTSPITVTNGDGVSANPTIALNTVPIASGGTGQTTQQAALNALAGATTSGQYLRGNGTNVTMSTIQAADIPAQITSNTTGSAATLTTARTIQTNLASTTAASFNGSADVTPGVTGTLPIANGGTNLNTLPQAGQVLIGNNASGYFLSRPTELPAAITSGTSVTFNFNYKSSGVFRLAHTTTTNINSFSYSNMVVGGIYAFHISGASNSAQITVQWPTGTNGFKDLTASTNYGTRVYTTPTIITCYYDGTQFVCE